MHTDWGGGQAHSGAHRAPGGHSTRRAQHADDAQAALAQCPVLSGLVVCRAGGPAHSPLGAWAALWQAAAVQRLQPPRRARGPRARAHPLRLPQPRAALRAPPSWCRALLPPPGTTAGSPLAVSLLTGRGPPAHLCRPSSALTPTALSQRSDTRVLADLLLGASSCGLLDAPCVGKAPAGTGGSSHRRHVGTDVSRVPCPSVSPTFSRDS